MRVLITGATGFAGGHLAEALLAGGKVDVWGVSRRGQWPAPLEHLAGSVRLLGADLTDRSRALELLREIKPQQIYHLAGHASVGSSFREPDAAWAINLDATRVLYDCIDRLEQHPRIVFVSSGLVYGDPEGPNDVLTETSPMRPAHPYATSKCAADLLSYQVFKSSNLEVIRARPFNHIGPRQSSQFAVASFARQIASIEHRHQPPVVKTGNLSSSRDLTDVRDVVRAYILLMQQGRPGDVYNIASGQSYQMEDVLRRLVSRSHVQVEVRKEEQRMRKVEPTAVRADAGKLQHETGWSPAYTLDQALEDTLNYWRRVEAQGKRA